MAPRMKVSGTLSDSDTAKALTSTATARSMRASGALIRRMEKADRSTKKETYTSDNGKTIIDRVKESAIS